MSTTPPADAPRRRPDLSDLPAPPRVPLRRRATRLLGRMLPLAVWCAALGGALWLYSEEPASNHAVGFVEVRDVAATPSQDGRVAALRVEVGTQVRAGDVIATLDTRELDAELRFARAKLERSRTRIAALREELRIDQEDRRAQADARRASYETEGRRIRDNIERLTGNASVDRASMLGLDPQIARLGPLVTDGLMPAERLEEAVRARNVLEARVGSYDERVRSARDELDAWRRTEPETVAELDPHAHLIPLEAELEVQEARIAALELRLEAHDVLAPTDGVVHRVVAWAGEWCPAGAPVVEIVASRPDRFTAYVTGGQVVDVTAGVSATIRPRDRRGSVLHGHVIAVAPRVDAVPQQLRVVPSIPEWGRLVTIALDDPVDTVPGEVYGVRFQ